MDQQIVIFSLCGEECHVAVHLLVSFPLIRVYLNMVREAVERFTCVKVVKLSPAKSRLGTSIPLDSCRFFEAALNVKIHTKSSLVDGEFWPSLADQSDG